MALRRFYKDDGDEILSEINIIPLVDISLVLLIIFMITANYIMTSSLSVDIPQAEHGKPMQQAAVVTIVITNEGPMYLENELVTSGELKAKMQAQYTKNQDISVILSAERNVSFKHIVKTIDMLHEVGVTKLNIAAVQE